MTKVSRSAAAACLLAASAALAACEGGTGSDPVASITFAADSAYLRINTTLQLAPVAHGGGGGVLPGVQFGWASSDPAVVSVSPAGLVTAHGYGAAAVTATAEGVTAAMVVVVTGTPGVTVVSGAGAQDSIEALPPSPLVVEVRDSLGLPLANEEVYFEDLHGRGPYDGGMQVLNFAPDGYGPQIFLRTDAAGRASTPVRMGTIPGRGGISVRALRLGRADTAEYVVRPGAAVRVRLAPRDTAVFAGRTVALRSTLTDRAGNPAAGPVTYAVLQGPLAVDAQSGVVGTPAFGAARIVARTGTGADTVRVTSVPEGAYAGVSGFGGIVLRNFDGTSRSIAHFYGGNVTWSPGGARILFESGGSLYTQTPGGTPVPLAHPRAGTAAWPRYSPNGAWVYFQSTVTGEPQSIWRVRTDGTGGERVQTDAGLRSVGHPSLSPDGTRMAFFAGGGPGTHIRVRDLATGSETGDLALGHTPAWSPSGEWIAFSGLRAFGGLPGPIMLIRPDGTGLRRVSPEGFNYEFSPQWSPDGAWIIASEYGDIHLIHVETGLTIELPSLESMVSLSWKPGGPLP